VADNRKTPLFDFDTGEFITDYGRIVTATGSSAVVEVLQKAQLTPRGKYLVYANPLARLNHKYGSDVQDIATRRGIGEELRLSELKRAVREAVLYDPWVKDVHSISVYRTGSGGVTADYVVRTIFDTELEVEGAILNG